MPAFKTLAVVNSGDWANAEIFRDELSYLRARETYDGREYRFELEPIQGESDIEIYIRTRRHNMPWENRRLIDVRRDLRETDDLTPEMELDELQRANANVSRYDWPNDDITVNTAADIDRLIGQYEEDGAGTTFDEAEAKELAALRELLCRMESEVRP